MEVDNNTSNITNANNETKRKLDMLKKRALSSRVTPKTQIPQYKQFAIFCIIWLYDRWVDLCTLYQKCKMRFIYEILRWQWRMESVAAYNTRVILATIENNYDITFLMNAFYSLDKIQSADSLSKWLKFFLSENLITKEYPLKLMIRELDVDSKSTIHVREIDITNRIETLSGKDIPGHDMSLANLISIY